MKDIEVYITIERTLFEQAREVTVKAAENREEIRAPF
jgi:hypothetical protein